MPCLVLERERFLLTRVARGHRIAGRQPEGGAIRQVQTRVKADIVVGDRRGNLS
jgi:hypothetical protein